MLIDTFDVSKEMFNVRIHHSRCHNYQFSESIEIFFFFWKLELSTSFRINKFSVQIYFTCNSFFNSFYGLRRKNFGNPIIEIVKLVSLLHFSSISGISSKLMLDFVSSSLFYFFFLYFGSTKTEFYISNHLTKKSFTQYT